MVVAIDGRAYDEAASLAAGWSVGDVPLVVWWNGPAPLDDHLFEHLLDLADRIVLDSSGMADCDLDYLALEGLLRRGEHARMSDLLWHRLQPWRLALAQVFDQPAERRMLNRIEACTVMAGNDRGGRAAALLLVGWLASRLNWELRSRVGANRWSAWNGKRALDIRIDIDPGDHALSDLSMTGARCDLRSRRGECGLSRRVGARGRRAYLSDDSAARRRSVPTSARRPDDRWIRRADLSSRREPRLPAGVRRALSAAGRRRRTPRPAWRRLFVRMLFGNMQPSAGVARRRLLCVPRSDRLNASRRSTAFEACRSSGASTRIAVAAMRAGIAMRARPTPTSI